MILVVIAVGAVLGIVGSALVDLFIVWADGPRGLLSAHHRDR